MIKSVCIFCGSSSTQGKRSSFKKEHGKIAVWRQTGTHTKGRKLRRTLPSQLKSSTTQFCSNVGENSPEIYATPVQE